MRSMRMAALAVGFTLAFSGLALARDNDNDRYRDKHEDHHHDWKYQRNHDSDNHQWSQSRREREREHERWERAHRNDGYYGSGSVYHRYPNGNSGSYGYPGGYGYPNGGGYGYPGGGYGYPNGGYPNTGTVYGRGNGGNMGYSMGYQDGSYRARKDIAENKPFNPNPRGDFGNRDHGYNGSYGDKNYYRAEYSRGYEAGYQANYRGGRGWGF
jgi:hypothetical protein